jgi:DNA-binding HxlR family transcriptional regulator
MEKEREEELLGLIGAKYTKDIMEYLETFKKAHYMDMAALMSTGTLNKRIIRLIRFKLIRHHLERRGKRIEWYEITEKGRRFLQSLRDIISLVEESSESEG